MKKEVDKFYLMKVFQAVAINGSFTTAAAELGITVSAASKAIKLLETSLGVALLHRTTRSISITDAGRDYLISSQHILRQFDELEQRLKQEHECPSGLLRISAPNALGQHVIAPAMNAFLREYSQIRMELIFSENLIDITEQGIDVAIRSRPLPPASPLYSKLLGTRTRKLVASRELLDMHFKPSHPNELEQLPLLNYQGMQVENHWHLTKDDDSVLLLPAAKYLSNNYHAIREAALGGLGVANLYSYLVDEDIKNGSLIHLFPDWVQEQRNIYAVYQQRTDLSPKLGAFISFLTELSY